MAENKNKKLIRKSIIEQPIIDQSNELMKKLLAKGKRKGFLGLTEIERLLAKESSETIEEFQSKISSLGIQIHEIDDEIENDDETKLMSSGYKEEDPGKTDDPVRMYLKEMGNVELLSREGEIKIAKRIEEGKKTTIEAFSSCFISMQYIDNFFASYSKDQRPLRDLIDLDSTYRSISGDDEEPVFINENTKENKEIFEHNVENEIDEDSDFTSDSDDENSEEVSELSILEKEENLRPIISDKLEKFSKKFRELKTLQKKYVESMFTNKKLDKKVFGKYQKLKKIVSEKIQTLYINQTRIDEIVEQLSQYSKRISISQIKLLNIAKKLRIKDDEFNNEFACNILNKSWLKNLSRRKKKNWVQFSKKDEVSQLFDSIHAISENTLMSIEEIKDVSKSVSKGVKESNCAKKRNDRS